MFKINLYFIKILMVFENVTNPAKMSHRSGIFMRTIYLKYANIETKADSSSLGKS